MDAATTTELVPVRSVTGEVVLASLPFIHTDIPHPSDFVDALSELTSMNTLSDIAHVDFPEGGVLKDIDSTLSTSVSFGDRKNPTFDLSSYFYTGAEIQNREDRGYFNEEARSQLAELFRNLGYVVEPFEQLAYRSAKMKEHGFSLTKGNTRYTIELGHDNMQDHIAYIHEVIDLGMRTQKKNLPLIEKGILQNKLVRLYTPAIENTDEHRPHGVDDLKQFAAATGDVTAVLLDHWGETLEEDINLIFQPDNEKLAELIVFAENVTSQTEKLIT